MPPSQPLIANMPSGRDIHAPKPYMLPLLDDATLARMRAPPDPDDFAAQEDDSGDSDWEDRGPPGAFPGGSDAASYY